ncbi:hypothetical protein QE450_002132 [Paenibacillus sp. SORGH_AS306]|nr:hypothetical protein [Paenibacillus sp. SORGH_AS_0306]MDR6111679.1 hypothetical protein [Paenibacillus sp. SORGH_AS_0338]
MFRSKQSKILLVVGIIFVLWIAAAFIVRYISTGA